MGYSTIKESASAEFVEKKSRFIATVLPVEKEEEKAPVASKKKKAKKAA